MLDSYYDLSVEERMVWVILIGVGIGLLLGIFMRRASAERLPVHGGFAAQFFHYLASSTISALIPVIFLAIFSKLNVPRVVLSGLIFSLSTWVFLFSYAIFEKQANYVVVDQIPTD